MKKAIIDKKTNKILHIYEGDVQFGGKWGNLEEVVIAEIPTLFAKYFANELEYDPITGLFGVTKEGRKRLHEEGIRKLRLHRVPLLKKIDRFCNELVLNLRTDRMKIRELRKYLLDITEPYKTDIKEIKEEEIKTIKKEMEEKVDAIEKR